MAVRFPKNLVQPEGSMRFGLDALLLACFAAREFGASPHFGLKNPCRDTPWLPPGPGFAAIDLGCGQGASTAALLLRSENVRALGVDFSPALIDAARKNISLLNLSERAAFRVLDLSRAGAAFPRPAFDLALSNPPYWERGEGRASYAPRVRPLFITDFSILSFPLPVSPPSRRPWAPAASACAKPSSCAPGRRTRQSACLWKQRRTPCTISAFSLISYSRKRTAAPRRRLFPSAPFWTNQPEQGKESSESPGLPGLQSHAEKRSPSGLRFRLFRFDGQDAGTLYLQTYRGSLPCPARITGSSPHRPQ